jgi:hypothetical protein
MNKKIILSLVVLATIAASCVKDLDVKPIDKNLILAGNLKDRQDGMKQTLAKIYIAFSTPGQTSSDNDISSSDANFTTFIRALWNCQELSTDEVVCAWGDAGISDLNYQTWTQNNPFLTGVYARIIYIVTLSNDYIRLTAGDTDPDMMKYNAEARFLRALAYYYAIDLFANPAYTTEADQIGSFYPKQIDRKSLYTYVESELLDIEGKLGAPKFEYGRADQAAAQMLLARLYLNAGVFTGTTQWDKCKTYCDKVINSGAYSLEPNYRKNFSSDNDQSKESIFAINADGINTQGYCSITFIMHSSCQGVYVDPIRLKLGTEGGWGGNRTKKQFANVLVDTLAVYGNNPVIAAKDTFFTQCKDKRVFIQLMSQWDIDNAGIFPQGIGVYKYTNSRSDGGAIVNYNNTFVSTDFIFFRLADAYLMRAEALLKSGGDKNAALADVNKIRERAFGNTSGNITVDKLTEKYLLDERGREFYYEAQRRTDLIRFGQFSNGTYTWAWKGGVAKGVPTDKHLDIFPIPGDEVAANLNIKQNPGY